MDPRWFVCVVAVGVASAAATGCGGKVVLDGVGSSSTGSGGAGAGGAGASSSSSSSSSGTSSSASSSSTSSGGTDLCAKFCATSYGKACAGGDQCPAQCANAFVQATSKCSNELSAALDCVVMNSPDMTDCNAQAPVCASVLSAYGTCVMTVGCGNTESCTGNGTSCSCSLTCKGATFTATCTGMNNGTCTCTNDGNTVGVCMNPGGQCGAYTSCCSQFFPPQM